jgi:uncharacterized protein with von Willebrand factor type A (vWA) domain
MVFAEFLWALRKEGLHIGVGEWLGFLDALERGIISTPSELYRVGRALLCRSEGEFDAWDRAFAASFRNVELSAEARAALEAWLENVRPKPEGPPVEHGMDAETLFQTLLDRMKEQKEEHHGGNRWIGTGGTSPFGNNGNAAQGVRIGGSGGGRQAVNVAMDRQWQNYRTDRTLDVRDFEQALRALRNLAREGSFDLDLDGTIRETCENAGDIELVEQRERANRVHVVLLMDAGGSMAPHYEKVSRLFSAAQRAKTFKSFQSYSFHNCVYGWLYKDIEQLDRVRTERVLADLTPRHRLIFVGDASMAPYELFTPFSWPGEGGISGLEWLTRIRRQAQASVWLNPDPKRYWQHPTVEAIAHVFPMYELTLDGLRDAIKKLRAPI